MNLGSLLVEMNAESKKLARGMQEGLSAVKSSVREMKKAAAEIGAVGVAVTAFFTGMVKAASTVDFGVKKQLDRLKDSFLTLAVQIAQMVAPAIRQLTQMLKDTANWFAGLPNSTKQTISHFALLAAQVGGAALAFSKLAGLVRGVVTVFSMFSGVVAALGAGGLLLIVGGLVAVITAVVVLHKAWRQNWGGIQEHFRSVIETLSGWWQKFAGFLGDVWSMIVDDAAEKMKMLVALYLKVMTMTGKMDENSANLVGKGMEMGINAVTSAAKSPMAMKNLALEAAKTLKEGAIDVVKEFKLIGKELRDALGLNSSGAHARSYTSSKVGKGGAYEPYSEGVENAIKHSLDQAQRLGGTSAAPGQLGGVSAPMNYDEVQAMLSKNIEDAWSAEDWGGVFAGVKDKIVESMTSLEKLGDALKYGAETMFSKMGQMGEIIQAGFQGFQNGGVWGAVIGVILDVLSKFKRWSELEDLWTSQVQTLLQEIGGGLSSLVDGFKSFNEALEGIYHVIHQILEPILKLVGRVLSAIAPIIGIVAVTLQPIGRLFDMIGQLLESLAPALEMIGNLLKGIGDILGFLGKALEPVFIILGWVFKIVAETILGTVNGILLFWGGILNLVYQLLRALGLNGMADDLAKTIWDNNKNIENVQTQMKQTWDGTASTIDTATNSVAKLGATADHVSEQLSNVPNGFFVALKRAAAIGAAGTTSSTAGGGGVHGSSSIYDAWSKGHERQSFRQSGNPTSNTSPGSAAQKRKGEI